MNDTCLLIPALEPQEHFIDYVKKLKQIPHLHIVVVNDGSHQDYDIIFNKIARLPQCYVIHHPQNLGKGEALKSGYRFIQKHLSFCQKIICADCDGQHAVIDIQKMIAKMYSDESLFMLGMRNFSFRHVPIKSWLGNRMASLLLWMSTGHYIQDTQTGLRGYDYQLLDSLLKINGQRFEYETNALVILLKQVNLNTIPIQTIYYHHNQHTHFRPIQDTWLIIKSLYSSFYLYTLLSFLCFMIDWLVFIFLSSLFIFFFQSSLTVIFCSSFISRFLSIICHYQLVQKHVFQPVNQKQSMSRYMALCKFIVFLSSIGTYCLHFLLSTLMSKILIDGCLFFLSYAIQKKWVFS